MLRHQLQRMASQRSVPFDVLALDRFRFPQDARPRRFDVARVFRRRQRAFDRPGEVGARGPRSDQRIRGRAQLPPERVAVRRLARECGERDPERARHADRRRAAHPHRVDRFGYLSVVRQLQPDLVVGQPCLVQEAQVASLPGERLYGHGVAEVALGAKTRTLMRDGRWDAEYWLVEIEGLEPSTSALRTQRSPN